MTITFVDEARAIDSLRKSDFDAVSAYCEVIDNSIQADSKNINVMFDTQPGSSGYFKINKVIFGDDGKGMDFDTLHRCLKLGWSSRYNSQKGIGRFGVGMTLAAIHECKRVEVYSKTSISKTYKTYIDLEEIENMSLNSIPEPSIEDVPDEYKDLIGVNSGTLVIWSKYDRQEKNAIKLIEESEIHFGRTYRYFIWDDGVSIKVNKNEIYAIDPLYYRTDKTKFPNDPKAELADDIIINYDVSKFDDRKDLPSKSEIKIKLSLLPEEFRPEQGAGNKRSNIDRYIHENEGISILRDRREVFYGHINYWKSAGKGWPQWEDKDRWWGGEVHFNPVHDHSFDVKNIKRGAQPRPELKHLIKEQIIITRNDYIKQIDKVWKKAKSDKLNDLSASNEDPINRPRHLTEAENIAINTPSEKSELFKNKDPEVEANEIVNIKYNNLDEEKKIKLKEMFKTQPFTLVEAFWGGPTFFEASHYQGKAVLEFNKSHLFFEILDEVVASVNNDDSDKVEIVNSIKKMMDVLLMAYAESEKNFDEDEKLTTIEFIDKIRTGWGKNLNNYLSTWKSERKNDS